MSDEALKTNSVQDKCFHFKLKGRHTYIIYIIIYSTTIYMRRLSTPGAKINEVHDFTDSVCIVCYLSLIMKMAEILK